MFIHLFYNVIPHHHQEMLITDATVISERESEREERERGGRGRSIYIQCINIIIMIDIYTALFFEVTQRAV